MNDLYHRIFDQLPCWVSTQDRDFHIIAANAQFRRDFGDHIGSFCYQVIKGRSEKCLVCPVEQTFQDGVGHRSEEIVNPVRGEDVCAMVYTSPIRDDDGNITAVVEVFADITAVKRLQQKYQTLYDAVPCYITVQDRNLKLLEANPRFKQDFGPGIGEHCYDVYKHRTEPCMVCPVAQVFQDGGIHQSEELVTPLQGEPAHVLVYAAPITNAEGEIVSVMEMSTNITKLRELQSQLESTGLIIGSVSHGIKGLLSGVDGGVYLMESGFQKNRTDRIQQGLEMVRRNADRIRNMVLGILYYVKDREVFWEPLDLEEMASAVIQLLESRAESLGIKLRTEIVPGGFEGDRNAIHSLLINLMENSLDACRVDKRTTDHQVVLAGRPEGDQVLFEVTDNGIGMDRETREKAFSLFFSSKGTGGTGLGLFIANKIAKSHGGSIEVESSPGIGTHFRVSIPVSRSAGSAAEPAAGPASPPAE